MYVGGGVVLISKEAKSIGSLGDGVTGGCESPDVGVGD